MPFHETNEIVLSPESVQAAIQNYINAMLMYDDNKIRVTQIVYYKKSRRVRAVIEPAIKKSAAKRIEDQAK